MSELEEIDPQDSTQFNPHFHDAANMFAETVDMNSVVKTMKGKIFINEMTTWLQDIQKQSKKELDIVRSLISNERHSRKKGSESKLPRSAKFVLFTDALLKKCTDDNSIMQLNKSQLEEIYDAIMREFLKQTVREAGNLLKEMQVVVEELDAEMNELVIVKEHENEDEEDTSYDIKELEYLRRKTSTLRDKRTTMINQTSN